MQKHIQYKHVQNNKNKKHSDKKQSHKHTKKIRIEQFNIHYLTPQQKQYVKQLQESGFTYEESYFLSLNTKERIDNAIKLIESGLESEYSFTLSNKENTIINDICNEVKSLSLFGKQILVKYLYR